MPAIAPALQSLVDALYARSDVGPAASSTAHADYVDLYTPTATLIMGPTTYEGHEGIQRFREAGWDKVATRKHVVLGVYPHAEGGEKGAMVYGTVDYGMKDGSSKEGIEWSGRFDLVQSGGELKIQFYQVYITAK